MFMVGVDVYAVPPAVRAMLATGKPRVTVAVG
jgi:hypothetical protein